MWRKVRRVVGCVGNVWESVWGEFGEVCWGGGGEVWGVWGKVRGNVRV